LVPLIFAVAPPPPPPPPHAETPTASEAMDTAVTNQRARKVLSSLGVPRRAGSYSHPCTRGNPHATAFSGGRVHAQEGQVAAGAPVARQPAEVHVPTHLHPVGAEHRATGPRPARGPRHRGAVAGGA